MSRVSRYLSYSSRRWLALRFVCFLVGFQLDLAEEFLEICIGGSSAKRKALVPREGWSLSSEGSLRGGLKASV